MSILKISTAVSDTHSCVEIFASEPSVPYPSSKDLEVDKSNEDCFSLDAERKRPFRRSTASWVQEPSNSILHCLSVQTPFFIVCQFSSYGSIKLLPGRVDWIGLKWTKEGEADCLTLLWANLQEVFFLCIEDFVAWISWKLYFGGQSNPKYNLEKHLCTFKLSCHDFLTVIHYRAHTEYFWVTRNDI